MVTRQDGSMTNELITWLTARLDEHQEIATAATPGPWRWGDWSATFGTLEQEPYVLERAPGLGPFPTIRERDDESEQVLRTEYEDDDANANRAYIAHHHPTRTLADIAAKRAHIARWAHVDALLADATEPSAIRNELLSVRRAYALAVADDALAYADRPGWREEWRPDAP